MGPLLLRAAARHDINEASHWYDQRRIGLGEEFLGELGRTLERIQQSPEVYEGRASFRAARSRPAISLLRVLLF
jgi:hypothetical protein